MVRECSNLWRQGGFCFITAAILLGNIDIAVIYAVAMLPWTMTTLSFMLTMPPFMPASVRFMLTTLPFMGSEVGSLHADLRRAVTAADSFLDVYQARAPFHEMTQALSQFMNRPHHCSTSWTDVVRFMHWRGIS
eukprot:2682966-Rhodomonas_salina.1